MNTTATVDLSGLNYSLGELAAVLKTDSRQIVRTEAALLAGDIADGLGPQNISRGNSSVLRGVKKSFMPLKRGIQPFFGTGAGKGDMHWLFGTKKNISALVGADPVDVRLDANAGTMLKIRKFRKGAAWQDLGNFSHLTSDARGRKRRHYTKFNGSQHAYKINRAIVTPEAFKDFLERGKKFVGQLKASFSYAAQQLGRPERRQWVSRHFSDKAGGKAILIDASNTDGIPSITFGSSAKGVVSNPKIAAVIQGRIQYRSKLLAEKVKKVLRGYSYDFNNGRVFKPRAEK